MKKCDINELCQLIDHTNLKPYATRQDMKVLCNEAKKYNFKMVAINQVQTKLCSELLKGSCVGVGAAISFPLGQTSIESKLCETQDAIENGATEIDYVINISEVKNGNFDYIKKEMEEIVALCQEHQVISKVIFENCYLSKLEIKKLAEIAKFVRPDFIKTSKGFAEGGATIEDVKLMKSVVEDKVQVKAAGQIRDAETFLNMIQAGATRIGTSSGIKIIEELKTKYSDEGSLLI